MSSLQEVFDMALVQLALWGKESLSTHKPAMNFMIFFFFLKKTLTKLNMSIVSWFNESREGKEVVLGMWDFLFLKTKWKLKTKQCCKWAQTISAGKGIANKEGCFKDSISNEVPL